MATGPPPHFPSPGETPHPVPLRRMQMVVALLPSQADPRGQCRRRGGRGQLGEESTPHGLQGHRRRRRIIDDLDIEHEERVALTTIVVKHGLRLEQPQDTYADCPHSRRPLYRRYLSPRSFTWYLTPRAQVAVQAGR